MAAFELAQGKCNEAAECFVVVSYEAICVGA